MRRILERLAEGDLLVLAALVAAVLTPTAVVERGPRLCLISRVIGRPCPACGLSRSWVAFAHGDMRGSLARHPLGPATVALAVVVALRSLATRHARRV